MSYFDRVSQLGTRFQSRRFYLIFCVVCFVIALTLGLLVTQSGSGLSPDSTAYITAGENVYSGEGFLRGHPDNHEVYSHWPPLYPLSIAAFMHLGLDSEQAARIIPILCFALLMFPLFFIGKIIDGVFTGYVACLMCLVFTPLLRITSYAWTEMPYIFFSVLAILFLIKFSGSNKSGIKMLCLAGFFTALTILMRYIGVTLLLVGLLVLIIKNKSQLKRAVSQILIFGSISCLPLILWLCRNVALTSHLAGGRGESITGLLTNVDAAVVTILGDFFGGTLSGLLSHLRFYSYVGLAIVVICFVLLAVYVKKHSTESNVWLKYIGKNYIVISYAFVYLITLILMSSIWRFDPINPRLTSPAYPFLILAVISFVFYAYRQIKKPSLKTSMFSIITILFVLFLVFQAGSTLSFYQNAKHGQGYNSPFWRNSEAIAWVASNVPDDVKVYSNDVNAVVLRIESQTCWLPPSGNEGAIENFIENLKSEGSSFIIAFKEEYRKGKLTNSELTEINQKNDILIAVVDFPEATVWCTSGGGG